MKDRKSKQLTKSIIDVEGTILESPISIVEAVAPALGSSHYELLGRPGAIKIISAGTRSGVIEARIPWICRLPSNGSG